MNRSGRIVLGAPKPPPPEGILDVLRQGHLSVLLLPLAMLLAGWGARVGLARRTVAYSWRGIGISHPAGWVVTGQAAEAGAQDSVVLTDLLGPGRIKPRVTLRVAPLPSPPAEPGAPPAEAAVAPADQEPAPPTPSPTLSPSLAPPAVTGGSLENPLPLYYAMSEQSVQVAGYPATRIESAFAFTQPALTRRKKDIPVVMRAIDVVILRGVDALSIQVAAPIEDFENQRPALEAVLASLKIDPSAAPQAEAPSAPPVPVAFDPGSDDVTVNGQVVDAESGLPVPGAIVVFLSPGSSVDGVTDDNLATGAYTTALSDSTGRFLTSRALARSAHYGVMVVADGYRWVGSDDSVAPGADAPTQWDMGSIPLRRR